MRLPLFAQVVYDRIPVGMHLGHALRRRGAVIPSLVLRYGFDHLHHFDFGYVLAAAGALKRLMILISPLAPAGRMACNAVLLRPIVSASHCRIRGIGGRHVYAVAWRVRHSRELGA